MAPTHQPQRFAVIGLGRFGRRLAVNLTAAGQEVIAVDKQVATIEEIRDEVTVAVAMDATDEQALRAQGIDQVDAAVVGIGEHFQARVLVTVILKQLGVARVIGRAVTPADAQVMRRVGADEVVTPEDESADRWSDRLANPWFLSRFELDSEHSVVELDTPAAWVGKTLSALELRRRYGVHVVALRSSGSGSGPPAVRIPRPDQPLAAEDVLVLMGREADITRAQEA